MLVPYALRAPAPVNLGVRPLVKTYPVFRGDGSMLALEVTSAWLTFRPLFSIMRSVPGVVDVRRQYFNEDRILFVYLGVDCVINEPWGDNSRYWIGPKSPEISSIDMAPINIAFQNHQTLLGHLWGFFKNAKRF